MNLQNKVTLFFGVLSLGLVAALVVIGLWSFRQYSVATASEHIRTAAEIVRVHLTESMINGVISKRQNFLERLKEVEGLQSARVIRGSLVQQQFGKGFNEEQPADSIEMQVLADGKQHFDIIDANGPVIIRGTIPFVAHRGGNPNCLQCHQVAEGSVLGAVTITMSIEHLKRKAIYTVLLMVAAVTLFAFATFFLLRRFLRPIVDTAVHVEKAVHRAIGGEFKASIEVLTRDEIGRIANDVNRLLAFLDQGLTRISRNVALLTEHTPAPNGNQLQDTIDMVDALTQASQFKQAIEEDETKAEVYCRLASAVEGRFGVKEYSMYELVLNRNQIKPMVVDGEADAGCKWCDPLIQVRSESCRVRRTGHLVDGLSTPDICYAFKPPAEAPGRHHICFPIMSSGGVGSVLQLVVDEDNIERVKALTPYINVYLQEAAPVLEAKRLTETLRESNLRDPMTGLHNRRFLEESVDSLVANTQRRGGHLGVMMLDLDYFKMVNDTYGHDAGDAVLKALAKVLAGAVRSSDMVIRYGGEEFMIILQNTDGDGAIPVAEKIRTAVEELKVQVAGGVLQKTISIGIADFPKDSDTFWQAIKFADVALYRAKEDGRNRVVRFTPELWDAQNAY
ncbi:MAG TPA: diguanylate cyclase [Rhodocyclaceae bacterium]